MSDINNINKIKDFLSENEIKFSYNEKETSFDFLGGHNQPIKIIYANSIQIKLGSKRFGYEGTNNSYCLDISEKNKKEGIRTIWWNDYEIENPVCKDSLRKENVIKSYILSACGKVKNKVFARNTEIKEFSNKEVRKFLETNSFYGYRSASKTLGLVLKKDCGDLKAGELLMMMSFGQAFFASKKGISDIECIRSSTKLHTQVLGGSSKILKHFCQSPSIIFGGKEHTWEKMIFYVDADHNDSSSMETLGFEFFSKTAGFLNIIVETGEVRQRKPTQHKLIMERMARGEIISKPTCGVYSWILDRNKYLCNSKI